MQQQKRQNYIPRTFNIVVCLHFWLGAHVTQDNSHSVMVFHSHFNYVSSFFIPLDSYERRTYMREEAEVNKMLTNNVCIISGQSNHIVIRTYHSFWKFSSGLSFKMLINSLKNASESESPISSGKLPSTNGCSLKAAFRDLPSPLELKMKIFFIFIMIHVI